MDIKTLEEANRLNSLIKNINDVIQKHYQHKGGFAVKYRSSTMDNHDSYQSLLHDPILVTRIVSVLTTRSLELRKEFDRLMPDAISEEQSS